MPLFAEGDVNNGVTLVAVAFTAVNGLFMWLASREKRLSDKDRMDADAERVQMRSDIRDCKEDRDELRVRVKDQDVRIKSLEDLFRPPVKPDTAEHKPLQGGA